MRVTKNYFLVGINKEAQKLKMKLASGSGLIIAADTYTFMKNYLQSAPIWQIGANAKKFFPEAQEGDELIFHHTVEDDEWRLLQTTTDVEGVEWEWRIVKADIDDVFGIRKPDGTLIAAREHIWCKELEGTKTHEEAWVKKGSLFITNEGYLETEEAIRARIDEIDLHIKYMCEGVNVTEEIVRPLKQEQAALTKKLNKEKLHPLELVYIHPQTAREDLSNIEAGDHIYMKGWIDYNGYPLTIFGESFVILRVSQVELALRKKFITDKEKLQAAIDVVNQGVLTKPR